MEWQPDLVVVAIGDENVPPKGTKDPEILRWIQNNGFISTLVEDPRSPEGERRDENQSILRFCK
ncbi:hypothetical protein [Okeania sp. SIO2B3]|uniref:hypothetical protein n=1 Tax=Okeania sp. SIO2B3 TaxID=2607784 RepID=UPI0025D147EE|nr:hypothetical protein [Okeania sp. SIO2B3]